VATEAAGEGINLQFCRLMINYDLPWNPTRLEQRLGRIHRIGQERDVHAFNFVATESEDGQPVIEGRILQRRLQKLEQMRAVLADRVFDVIGEVLSLNAVNLPEMLRDAANDPRRLAEYLDRIARVDPQSDRLASVRHVGQPASDYLKVTFRKAEFELAAEDVAIAHETGRGWECTRVGHERIGFDIRSQGPPDPQTGYRDPMPLRIQNPAKHLEHAAKPVVAARFYDQGEQFEFNYLLRVTADRDSSSLKQSLKVVDEVLKLTAGRFQQTPLLENHKGQAKLLHEKRFLGETPGSDNCVATLAPQDATMLSRLYDLDTNHRANLFKRYLQSWSYYNLYPHALRNPEVVNERALIGHDGSNLTKVLYTLHNEKPRLERKIIEMVRTLEPKLDLFTFTAPDPESVYLFLEDQSANRFSTQSISDGTLRFLAMAYLILTQGNLGEASGWAPLILIEEPENGLYVGHLKLLLERIDPSGRCGQFLFTSHSPYFIDLWDSNLEGLHLLKPGKPSSVLVRPAPDTVRRLLDQMPLGEMHYREMLA
jgi:predicted ATPase